MSKRNDTNIMQMINESAEQTCSGNDSESIRKRFKPAEQTETEIDLIELFFAILSRWKILLAVTVICALLAGLYNFFLIKPTYQAEAEIYITNTDTVINVQDVQLSSELAVDYERIFMSRTVLKKVVNELNLKMTHQDLRKLITVTNPEDSHILLIDVETSDPKQSIVIANTLVRFGKDQIYRVVGNDEPTIIDSAQADAVNTLKPSLIKYVGMGGILGAFIVCALIVIQVIMDTTLKNQEDVEKYLELPLVGEVPEDEEKEN